MGRLRVPAGKEICTVPARHRFLEAPRRGSHVVMQKPDVDATITVPAPDHAELRRGTLESIIRQSGVPRSEFES